MAKAEANWERLVRAALRGEWLGGAYGQPVTGIAGNVPSSSLSNSVRIEELHSAVDEIQDEDPNIARILSEHAYTLSQSLDPNSEGARVLQFRTALTTVFFQKLTKSGDGSIDRSQDFAKLQEFYKLYREKHKVDEFIEDEVKLRESAVFNGNFAELEQKTRKQKKVFVTLKVLWSIIEDMTNDISREDAKKSISEEGTSVTLGDTNSEPPMEFFCNTNGNAGCANIQRLDTETVHEDSRYMEHNILERIVNGSEEPSALGLALLQSITENFSEKKKIGSGGCGIVYKGILRNGVVAVKRLLNIRTIKDKMFHREVTSLISIKHQNIVRFLGYCSFTEEHAILSGGRTIMADIRERLLCFEYIRNGSLEKHLTDELRGLEWQTCYQIIIGICRGLYYLHKDKGIIHMDLKPGNILLDDLMVPKITDFGLSRPDGESQATTTLLISQGYVAPEYISGGKATRKSDIYSLGVTIIELVSGNRMKPNITKVLRRWNHRWTKSMKQSSLGYQQVAKCLEVALRCTQDVPTDRPDISDIIDELDEIDTIDDETQIQISSCCLEDILGIEPLEIHIPFEDFKVPHSIELTNDTDDYIAFATKAKLERFCTEPDRGIVPPRSKCNVTIVMQAQVSVQPNKHYTEVITVLSTRVDDGGIATMDIVTAGDIFFDSEEGKVVDEVNVTVVLGTPELPEED